MGLSLENLAQIIHMDKQHLFAEECFVRQIELAQNHKPGVGSGFAWGRRMKRMIAYHLVVTLTVRPLRLTVQWV